MTNTIDQDFIDDAKEAGAEVIELYHSDDEIGVSHKEYSFEAHELAKLAQLQRERQAQPTPSQSVDERAEFDKNLSYDETGLIIESASNFGFEPNNDDATEYKATEESIVKFATAMITCKASRKYWQARAQLSKPQPQAVKDALEQAANIVVEQRGKDGIAIANKILALIQTEKS